MSQPWELTWNEKTERWEVDFSVLGRRIRKRLAVRDRTLGSVARELAQKFYRQAWAEILIEAPEAPSMPFYEAARLYAEEGYDARFLPRIMKHLGPTVTIDDIDDVKIAEIGAALYPQGAPDTKRRQVKVPIMAVCRWARGERRKPSTDRPRIRWLTSEEAERLIDAAAQLSLPRHSEPERFTLAKIAFLLGTGCRAGECFAADVSDWNPATGEWWIPAQEAGAGKTMRSARWALVAPRAVELMGDLPLHGRAFRTPYGQPIVLRKNGGGQMAAAFEKARIAAGLGPDETPHVLRHTWATWRYAQTGDLLGLMRRGGWAKADTAARYTHLAPLDLAERLDAHGWDLREPRSCPQPALCVVK